MKRWRVNAKRIERIYALIGTLILLGPLAVMAQTADGNTGINQANTMVRSYFDTGVNLMYAVGARVILEENGVPHPIGKVQEGLPQEANMKEFLQYGLPSEQVFIPIEFF